MGSQIGALFKGFVGDAGQEFVDLQGGKTAVFGRKPKVADYVPVNLSDEQQKTVSSNLENADSIMAMLDKLVPNFSSTVKAGMDNALALTQGQIPQDVQDQIMRTDAFKSILGGFSGSGMSRNMTARDFGLTSVDLMQRGQNSAQTWAKLAETSLDPFILKTMQQAGTTSANNQGIQEQKQRQFNVDAAPDPGAAGVFALDAALGQQMLSMGGAMGGAAMAGGGGSSGASAAGAAAGAYMNSRQAGASPAYGYSGNSLGGGYAAPNAYAYDPSTGRYEVATWGGG